MSFIPIPNSENKQSLAMFHQEIRKRLGTGVSHTEVINGKTFTYTDGVLVSVK